MQHDTRNTEQTIARSVESAAKAIGIGRSTMYELMNAGTIRSFKLGKRTLVPESELRRFVAERMAAA